MNYLIGFLTGAVMGILVAFITIRWTLRDLKLIAKGKLEDFKDKVVPQKTQFIEPVSDREKFEAAETIDDLLEK